MNLLRSILGKRKRTGEGGLGCSTIFFGLIILCAAVAILPFVFGGDAEPAYDPSDFENTPVDQRDPNDSDNNDVFGSQSTGNVDLGNLVTTTRIDRDGCPMDRSDTFGSNNDIYVVAPNSRVPEGTEIFARMYYNNEPVEDSQPIIADQDYTNSCVNFVFESNSFSGFGSGEYEVEYIVNGNPYDSVTFDVQ